jgi:hypothetical protein
MKHTWKRKTEFVTVGHKSDAVDQVDSSVQPSVAVNQEVDNQETPTLGNRRKELEPAPKPSRQPPPAASKLRSPSWKPIKKLRSPSWKPFHTQKQDKRSHIPPPSELTMPKLVTKKREQKASAASPKQAIPSSELHNHSHSKPKHRHPHRRRAKPRGRLRTIYPIYSRSFSLLRPKTLTVVQLYLCIL